MRPRCRIAITGAAALVAGLWCTTGTAGAHIDPDPLAVQAGTSATVVFTVEHGCGASPTNSLVISLPDGLTAVKAAEKAGWSATVEAKRVTFTGGPSPKADAVDTFGLSFTVPATAGELHFPVVQRCVEGETDWLQIAQPGQAEPERPAATLKVTAGPPTAADLAKPEEDAEGHPETTSGTPGSSSRGPLIVGLVIAGVVVVGGVVGAVTLRRR